MVVELSRSIPRLAAAPRGITKKGIAVAVVGCGYWGAKHVRVLSTLRDVAEVIVVDPDQRARDTIAAAFPSIELVADLRLALSRVDAVVVATPPRNHAAVALQAMRAGKHVLVEKPLAATVLESRALVAEAARYGVVLMVGHTFEFNPAVRELRRRMDDGDFGDIQYLHSARLNLGLYRPDVNVVWDLAPHDISIMNYLLRSTPTAVRAWGSSNVSAGQADVAYFQLTYARRNVVGYGHVSWLDPRKVRQVTVVGSRKMAVYDDLAEERLRIFDRGVEHAFDDSLAKTAPHAMPVSYRYGDIVSPHIHFQEPLVLEDQHFVDCVLGTVEPLSDGASGLAVIESLDAIDRALLTGQSVDVSGGSPVAAPPTAMSG